MKITLTRIVIVTMVGAYVALSLFSLFNMARDMVFPAPSCSIVFQSHSGVVRPDIYNGLEKPNCQKWKDHDTCEDGRRFGTFTMHRGQNDGGWLMTIHADGTVEHAADVSDKELPRAMMQLWVRVQEER